ncbi:MAG: DUF4160 domain-containing protein [Bacteroidota bacterium]
MGMWFRENTDRETLKKSDKNLDIAPSAGPYRFFFYSGDSNEPPHVHVEREDKIAKFWLNPVRIQTSGGFSRMEIVRIERMVREHNSELMEA